MAARFADAVTLDQLELFLEVVDSGSFTKAAEKLRRAQSAVSYGVSQLERQLGVKLLERSPTGAKPTPQGRILLVEAREVIAHADRLRAAGLAFAEEVEPEVSLSVSPLYPLDRLAEVALEMRDRYPHTVLRLHAGNLGATVTDVASGRTTLGITGLELAPSMIVHLATPVSMVRVVGPKHALASHTGPITTAILRKHLQLVAMDTSEMSDKISLHVLSPRTWRVADTMIRYKMTRAGVGWTHFTREWIAEDLASGALVELPFGPKEIPPSYTPRIFYRGDAPPGPAGRWLVDRLCGDPAPEERAESSKKAPPKTARRRVASKSSARR